MPDLFQYSGSRLLLARRDGKVVLDTADRMPAITGQLSETKVAAWPRPTGEVYQTRVTSAGSIEFRWVMPASETSFDVDLGPAPTDYTPNFLLARVNGSRAETANIYSYIFAEAQIRPGRWRQVNAGSVYIEQFRSSNPSPPIVHRHMSFAVAGGRWVLRCRHSSRAFATPWTTSGKGSAAASASSAATWTFQVAMAWGVFDL